MVTRQFHTYIVITCVYDLHEFCEFWCIYRVRTSCTYVCVCVCTYVHVCKLDLRLNCHLWHTYTHTTLHTTHYTHIPTVSGFSFYQFYCFQDTENFFNRFNENETSLTDFLNETEDLSNRLCVQTEIFRSFISSQLPWFQYQKETWLAIGKSVSRLFVYKVL